MSVLFSLFFSCCLHEACLATHSFKPESTSNDGLQTKRASKIITSVTARATISRRHSEPVTQSTNQPHLEVTIFKQHYKLLLLRLLCHCGSNLDNPISKKTQKTSPPPGSLLARPWQCAPLTQGALTHSVLMILLLGGICAVCFEASAQCSFDSVCFLWGLLPHLYSVERKGLMRTARSSYDRTATALGLSLLPKQSRQSTFPRNLP